MGIMQIEFALGISDGIQNKQSLFNYDHTHCSGFSGLRVDLATFDRCAHY